MLAMLSGSALVGRLTSSLMSPLGDRAGKRGARLALVYLEAARRALEIVKPVLERIERDVTNRVRL